MNTKYQEALERARERKKLAVQNGDDITVRVLDEIFPELRESEDEKIATRLIHLIHTGGYLEEPSRTRILAWLEKQKAKERLDRMAPIYNDKESFESALEKAWKYYNESASRKVDSFEDDYIECVFSKGFREGFLYKEKQKEQKPADDFDGKAMLYVSRKSYDMGYRDGVASVKPAEWSEEDKLKMKEIIDWLGHCPISEQLENEYISFLKSLKPQPKQEWSEEDRHAIENCEYAIKETFKDEQNPHRIGTLDWLKSLRPQSKDEIYKRTDETYKLGKHHLAVKFMNYLDDNRPEGKMGLSNNECESIDKAFKENDWATIMKYVDKYRPSWKPSEEQMRIIQMVLTDEAMDDNVHSVLESLYNDLKKLED